MHAATPPRLAAAKAAIATTALASTMALTVTLAGPGIVAMATENPSDSLAVVNQVPRQVSTEVALTAIGDVIGLYGVGPVFQALRLAGFGNAEAIITTAVGLINPTLGEQVGSVIAGLDAILPIDARVPGFGMAGVYDSTNNLAYTKDVFDNVPLVGPALDTLIAAVKALGGSAGENADTFTNQRRALILGTGLGGTDAAMALNRMISEVQRDSDLWGSSPNGVTGVVTVLLRNPSRPGGGLLALVTPITNIVGLNFSNPDAGSYTNENAQEDGLATKILNVHITDIGWKYDLIADAPSTLNPLAWANSVVGMAMPTYLLPADLNTAGGAIGGFLGDLTPALTNAGTTLIDPFGGQGLGLLTQGTPVEGAEGIIEVPADALLGVLNTVIKGSTGIDFKLGFPMKGEDFYLTYDSGNLPLLEPFHVLPRLLGYTGAAVSTPFTSSFNNVLTQLVATGYQDVKGVEGANGVWTFDRTMDMGADQADIFKLPDNLTWQEQFEIPQTVWDATLTGHRSGDVTW